MNALMSMEYGERLPALQGFIPSGLHLEDGSSFGSTGVSPPIRWPHRNRCFPVAVAAAVQAVPAPWRCPHLRWVWADESSNPFDRSSDATASGSD